MEEDLVATQNESFFCLVSQHSIPYHQKDNYHHCYEPHKSRKTSTFRLNQVVSELSGSSNLNLNVLVETLVISHLVEYLITI